MELLADENADTEWIQALRGDGHDVVRVVDIEDLGVSAADPEVLAFAIEAECVLLTADQADFSDPATDDHSGIIVVTSTARSGDELRRGVRWIEREYPNPAGGVLYLSDWL